MQICLFLPQNIFYKNLMLFPPNCGLPWWLSGKISACNAAVSSSIPRPGRSPGDSNGNQLQYSFLAWEIPWTVEPDERQVHGVASIGHN